MDLQLSATEIRVLGSLVEKEITTPEYYPLSLNALINACNQKSNRDPVLSLTEDEVRAALSGLTEKHLVNEAGGFDSRVPKYAHQLAEAFNFDNRETAVLCVLLLRGPQTPGELRARTERMYSFSDLTAIEFTLNRLIQRQPPLARQLERQPGTKESRYVHLLGGEIASSEELQPDQPLPFSRPSHEERISRLEAEVRQLDERVRELQRELAEFRKQFE